MSEQNGTHKQKGISKQWGHHNHKHIFFSVFELVCIAQCLSGCELHVDIVCGWSVIPARTTGMRSDNDSMKRASSSVNVSVWLFVVIAWGE